MPIILYVYIHLGRVYFKARDVKKDSVPDMIEITLTNIPVKNGIVYPDVDCFLYGLSFQKICGKYGVHTHFKGNMTLRQLLMKSKDQDPKEKKSGVIYNY